MIVAFLIIPDVFLKTQVLETLLHLRISNIDIQSLKQHNEKKSEVELKIEKNKNRMEKKLKGKMSKKEKKVQFPLFCYKLRVTSLSWCDPTV